MIRYAEVQIHGLNEHLLSDVKQRVREAFNLPYESDVEIVEFAGTEEPAVPAPSILASRIRYYA